MGEVKSFSLEPQIIKLIEANAECLGTTQSAFIQKAVSYFDTYGMDKALKEDFKRKQKHRAIIAEAFEGKGSMTGIVIGQVDYRDKKTLKE